MNELVKEKWYESLIEDCKSIITETIFNSRWALVEGYHQLGKRILEENDNFERAKIYGEKITTGLSESLGTSTRTIERAILFAKKYPELDKVPEGKNISWNKICNKYLPTPKENKITIPLPEGKFGVIVIDPPWPYGTEYNKETRRVASPYQELSIKELETIILPSADNCVLWLWTTHKFIWDAKKLMDLWEFEYKLILAWNKVRLGMGAWLRCQMEFCLLGIKGKPLWELTNQRDYIEEQRKEHSKKPDKIYSMAEELSPGPKDDTFYLDCFSREKRKGWAQFGNEI